jgi:hypothetical protein
MAEALRSVSGLSGSALSIESGLGSLEIALLDFEISSFKQA